MFICRDQDSILSDTDQFFPLLGPTMSDGVVLPHFPPEELSCQNRMDIAMNAGAG